MSSAVEMTRAFAWNPRCAMIMFVNSAEMSTFEPSSAPGVMDEVIVPPAKPTTGPPEFADSR